MSAAPPDRRARPGIGISAAVWFGSVAVSTVAFQIVLAASGRNGDPTDSLPFWLHPTLSLVTLWVPIFGALWWVHRRYPSGTFTQAYGIRFAWADLLGIPIGIACQLVVLRVLYWPLNHWFPSTFSRDDVERSARQLTERADGAWKIVLVVAVVIGAPFVEELLYRSLILGSLDRRIGRSAGLVVGALWFAAAHFQGVQFIGLLAFGLVLGTCWQRTGRIGLGVLAHAAFNATSLVLLWPKQ